MVVVECVAVDVAEHVPHLVRAGGVVEFGASHVAALDPEVLGLVESRFVELLERALRGDKDVPFDDGQGVVLDELGAYAFVEEHLVKHNGRSLRVHVFLQRGAKSRKAGSVRGRKAARGRHARIGIWYHLLFAYMEWDVLRHRS